MTKIIKNCAQCPDCQDVIESVHRHDYVKCKCGNIAVDGGKEYLRRTFVDKLPIELSETKDTEDSSE